MGAKPCPNNRFWEPFPRSFEVRPNTRKSCSRVRFGKVQRVGGIPKSTIFRNVLCVLLKSHLNDILHDFTDLGYPLGIPISPGNPIKFTLWRHMVENGVPGSQILPRASEMVPSGLTMTLQLSPKPYKYNAHMLHNGTCKAQWRFCERMRKWIYIYIYTYVNINI